jgi:hypothetical protein
MSMDVSDYDTLIAIMKHQNEQHPEWTTEDLTNYFIGLRDRLAEERKGRVCVHCHRPVAIRAGDWWHLMPDGENWSNKGCRAASYDWRDGKEGGWDESLDRSVMAKAA